MKKHINDIYNIVAEWSYDDVDRLQDELCTLLLARGVHCTTCDAGMEKHECVECYDYISADQCIKEEGHCGDCAQKNR